MPPSLPSAAPMPTSSNVSALQQEFRNSPEYQWLRDGIQERLDNGRAGEMAGIGYQLKVTTSKIGGDIPATRWNPWIRWGVGNTTTHIETYGDVGNDTTIYSNITATGMPGSSGITFQQEGRTVSLEYNSINPQYGLVLRIATNTGDNTVEYVSQSILSISDWRTERGNHYNNIRRHKEYDI